MTTILVILSVWTVLLAGGGYVAFLTLRDSRMRRRLFEAPAAQAAPPEDEKSPFLRHWLFLAGYRSPRAPALFVLATCILTALGALFAYLTVHSSLLQDVQVTIGTAPGGVLDLLTPLVYAAPWLIVIIPGLIPWLVVRSARRRRVRDIERDLPIVLELLSTLSEAGLAFDAALDRVMRGQAPNRPLTQELRLFRAETISGRPRVQSFRRLARRIDIPSFSSFVSAVVQAEQIGAGVADVLRRQADDNRARRRERALEMAMALPVKRLVPLVICFLPGLMLWALGPSLYELVQFVDAFSRNRGIK